MVVDERTNQIIPREFDVQITAKSSGKKYTVKVNSKSGDFLQPLASGETYFLSFQAYHIYKKVDTLDIPSTSKYREEKRNYKVRSIVAGESIANLCAFEPGQSEISPANMVQMRELLELIKQNRELQVVISVAPEQNPPSPVEPKKPAKAAKKVTKGKKQAEVVETVEPVAAPPSPDALLAQLNETRLTVLRKFFSEAKNFELRVRIEQGSPMIATAGQKNLFAKVGDVKSILDD